jgi:hypothetical protein
MNSRSGRLRLLAVVFILGLGGGLGMAAAPAGAAVVGRHASAPDRANAGNPSMIAAGINGLLANYNSGYCLDAVRAQLAVQSDCNIANGNKNELWHTSDTISVGGLPYYHIVNNNNTCLGVQNGSTSAGARVVGWSCNTNQDQYWAQYTSFYCPTLTGSIDYPIINLKSNDVLGVSGNSTADNANVVIWPYQDLCNNQFWGPLPM